ncbi:hypothetical protein GCM10020295_32630 [Streptomyces cinereospinus]
MQEVLGGQRVQVAQEARGVQERQGGQKVRDGQEAPEVLFLARLHPRKRPQAFVEMAALAHRRMPDARFTLHGADEGTLAGVRRLIAGHGLEGVVSYGGALAHAEAVRAYARAAVYVLPSVDEPFGMTVIEALAAGTPVVCTDTCGIAEELARRGAAVVTDGSPRQLADAVCALLADEGRRRALAAAGRRAVREAYSVHAVTDRLEEIYRRAAGGRRPGESNGTDLPAGPPVDAADPARKPIFSG